MGGPGFGIPRSRHRTEAVRAQGDFTMPARGMAEVPTFSRVGCAGVEARVAATAPRDV